MGKYRPRRGMGPPQGYAAQSTVREKFFPSQPVM